MREQVLEMLKRDAYRKGEFTLSSGVKSNHYVNCKPVTLNGRGLLILSLSLLENVEKYSTAVGGLTLGADPLVSGVEKLSLLPLSTSQYISNLDINIAVKSDVIIPINNVVAKPSMGPVPKLFKIKATKPVVIFASNMEDKAF